MNVDKQVLKAMVVPLLAEYPKVYVAVGCGRVYAAPIPSTKCKRCEDVHDNIEISCVEDLDSL
jgi:hypothetical protein